MKTYLDNKLLFNKEEFIGNKLAIRLVSKIYNQFISYSFYKFSYRTVVKRNYLRERRKHVYKLRSNIYHGFKIHCLGRFSRRQRSSSHFVHIGRVPLNTMKCLIDYAYYTLPITNSAITVKV